MTKRLIYKPMFLKRRIRLCNSFIENPIKGNIQHMRFGALQDDDTIPHSEDILYIESDGFMKIKYNISSEEISSPVFAKNEYYSFYADIGDIGIAGFTGYTTDNRQVKVEGYLYKQDEIAQDDKAQSLYCLEDLRQTEQDIRSDDIKWKYILFIIDHIYDNNNWQRNGIIGYPVGLDADKYNRTKIMVLLEEYGRQYHKLKWTISI